MQSKKSTKNNSILDFNRGKSTLFRLTEQSLHKMLGKIPLYASFVDLSDPSHSQLFGTSAIDMSCFAENVMLPSKDTKRGYRKGAFDFYDLMGNPVGTMHMILRLSCLGATLLPHLRVLPESITTNTHSIPTDSVLIKSIGSKRARVQMQADKNKHDHKLSPSKGMAIKPKVYYSQSPEDPTITPTFVNSDQKNDCDIDSNQVSSSTVSTTARRQESPSSPMKAFKTYTNTMKNGVNSNPRTARRPRLPPQAPSSSLSHLSKSPIKTPGDPSAFLRKLAEREKKQKFSQRHKKKHQLRHGRSTTTQVSSSAIPSLSPPAGYSMHQRTPEYVETHVNLYQPPSLFFFNDPYHDERGDEGHGKDYCPGNNDEHERIQPKLSERNPMDLFQSKLVLNAGHCNHNNQDDENLDMSVVEEKLSMFMDELNRYKTNQDIHPPAEHTNEHTSSSPFPSPSALPQPPSPIPRRRCQRSVHQVDPIVARARNRNNRICNRSNGTPAYDRAGTGDQVHKRAERRGQRDQNGYGGQRQSSGLPSSPEARATAVVGMASAVSLSTSQGFRDFLSGVKGGAEQTKEIHDQIRVQKRSARRDMREASYDSYMHHEREQGQSQRERSDSSFDHNNRKRRGERGELECFNHSHDRYHRYYGDHYDHRCSSPHKYQQQHLYDQQQYQQQQQERYSQRAVEGENDKSKRQARPRSMIHLSNTLKSQTHISDY